MSGKSSYFESMEPTGKAENTGVVYLNDLGTRSNSIFTNWSVPLIRPTSPKCAEKIANILMDESVPPDFSNTYLDALSEFLSERLTLLDALKEGAFFLIVSFNQKQKSNFDLYFSKNANPKLIEPIEKNFIASSQKFNSFYACTNILFQRIEKSFASVSCMELSFGSSLESGYSKERVFEETIIFAHLAVRKMI